jgi:general secretion pathway protein J
MHTRSNSHEAGFTLPELLVSLAIMALVSVVLFAGIGRIGIANALTSRGDALVDGVHSAQFLLRERIELIMPVVDQQTSYALDMAGTQSSLDFISFAPDHAAPDAPHHYRLKLDSHGALNLYNLSSLDAHVGAHQPEVTGWSPVPLLTGVSALALRYYGTDPATGTAGWQSSWTHRPTLPLLVAIRVSFPEGDPRAWPDLVIRPRAASSDSCRRDVTTDQCEGGT